MTPETMFFEVRLTILSHDQTSIQEFAQLKSVSLKLIVDNSQDFGLQVVNSDSGAVSTVCALKSLLDGRLRIPRTP